MLSSSVKMVKLFFKITNPQHLVINLDCSNKHLSTIYENPHPHTRTHTPVNSNTKKKKRILVRTKVITNSNSKSLQQTINHRQTLAQTPQWDARQLVAMFFLGPLLYYPPRSGKVRPHTHTHLRRLQRPKTIRKHERKTIPHTHNGSFTHGKQTSLYGKERG